MQAKPSPHPLTPTEESLAEFWSEIAKQTIQWIRPWDTVLSGDFKQGTIRWFEGGKLNVSANCLDRHLPIKRIKLQLSGREMIRRIIKS